VLKLSHCLNYNTFSGNPVSLELKSFKLHHVTEDMKHHLSLTMCSARERRQNI